MYIWKAVDVFWGIVLVGTAMVAIAGKRAWDRLHDERTWE